LPSTYNVGDPHVFFLPGHAFTALAVAALFSRRHLEGEPYRHTPPGT
jgi:hypothetical protein